MLQVRNTLLQMRKAHPETRGPFARSDRDAAGRNLILS